MPKSESNFPVQQLSLIFCLSSSHTFIFSRCSCPHHQPSWWNWVAKKSFKLPAYIPSHIEKKMHWAPPSPRLGHTGHTSIVSHPGAVDHHRPPSMATEFSGQKTRRDSAIQISTRSTASAPHELTELSVVDINASLAASVPMISSVISNPAPPASAATTTTTTQNVSTVTTSNGVGTAGGGTGSTFTTNLFNLSNSTDPAAVAYNSYTQNVRCKSPPTLVDNLKNGTIGWVIETIVGRESVVQL